MVNQILRYFLCICCTDFNYNIKSFDRASLTLILLLQFLNGAAHSTKLPAKLMLTDKLFSVNSV